MESLRIVPASPPLCLAAPQPTVLASVPFPSRTSLTTQCCLSSAWADSVARAAHEPSWFIPDPQSNLWRFPSGLDGRRWVNPCPSPQSQVPPRRMHIDGSWTDHAQAISVFGLHDAGLPHVKNMELFFQHYKIGLFDINKEKRVRSDSPDSSGLSS